MPVSTRILIAERESLFAELLGDYLLRIVTDGVIQRVRTIPEEGHRQLRHMLRFFCFPDRVERMSSSRERRKVLVGFNRVSKAQARSMDQRALDDALLTLRRELEEKHPGQPLDFYEPPLRDQWVSDQDNETHVEEPDSEYEGSGAVWWMNFNPKIFDIESKPDGHVERYSVFGESGRPRNMPEAFESAKPGDMVIGYSSTPRMRAGVLCQITKAKHEHPDDGVVIEFKRLRALKRAVTREQMLGDDEVDPESWTAGDGPHKPDRNCPTCPRNDASIVRR